MRQLDNGAPRRSPAREDLTVIGSKLGSYEVFAKLGEGGMGAVYRARDTRLDREVALKVLPASFASDPDRLMRFEREAKTLAALNHPHIAQIHHLEQHDQTSALVMELVEGEDLSVRIARLRASGASARQAGIPLDEALPIARQIAEALEAAHEAGIVHRDLKPANIKVRDDGTVKVLDFGLAKAMEPAAGSSPNVSMSPTLSIHATQAGIILGTAAYMSPEQAKGKPVDRRADIWAFGAVVYEMLTGRRAFEGEDISDLLVAVLSRDVDLGALPAGTPPRLRALLRDCLVRDPRQRLRDIGDARLVLDKIIAGAADEVVAPQAATVPRSLHAVPWAVASVLAVAAAAFAVAWYQAKPGIPPLRPLMHLNVDLGSAVSLASSQLFGANVVLSRDGQRVAFVSQSRLFTRRLDQPAATELAGTDGALAAVFSPDGQALAFVASNKLRRVPVDGGPVMTLADAASVRGASWGANGAIVVALSDRAGLHSVPEAGGTPVPLTELADGEVTHRWPQVLPGARAIIYTANATTGNFDGGIVKARSSDGRTKTLVKRGTHGRAFTTRQGHTYLLYVTDTTLMAAPLDLDRLELSGDAVAVLDGIGVPVSGGTEIDVSDEGTLVYRNTGLGLLSLQWMDASGALEAFRTKPDSYGRPQLSPDGGRVAVEVVGGTGKEIYVYDIRRDTMSRLTFGRAYYQSPTWTPDGRYIIYQDPDGMMFTGADGGAPQRLTRSTSLQFPWSFTPDGRTLAYIQVGAGGYDLWTLPLETDAASGLRAGKPAPLLATDFDERSPSLSPDGRWLAYVSNEGGSIDVYVRAFPDTGARWQLSSGGANYPIWSRVANELFFETADARIMVAPYAVSNGSFQPGKPRQWSPRPLVSVVSSLKNYDLAPDGKRIVAMMDLDEKGNSSISSSQVTLLLNFGDELDRRFAVRK
jgi:serine/threonine-protein kinase